MTERKFTPPTEFPSEYVTGNGRKVVILGRTPARDFPLAGYLPDGTIVCWTEGGSLFINGSSHSDLHDIRSVPQGPIVRWVVVGGFYDGCCYDTEEAAKHSLDGGGRAVKMVEETE